MVGVTGPPHNATSPPCAGHFLVTNTIKPRSHRRYLATRGEHPWLLSNKGRASRAGAIKGNDAACGGRVTEGGGGGFRCMALGPGQKQYEVWRAGNAGRPGGTKTQSRPDWSPRTSLAPDPYGSLWSSLVRRRHNRRRRRREMRISFFLRVCDHIAPNRGGLRP